MKQKPSHRAGGVTLREFFMLALPGCRPVDAARATRLSLPTVARLARGAKKKLPSAEHVTALARWSERVAASQHGVWIDAMRTLRIPRSRGAELAAQPEAVAS